MASEDELIEARRKHIEKLVEHGGSPFPRGFIGDDEARRRVVERHTWDVHVQSILQGLRDRGLVRWS